VTYKCKRCTKELSGQRRKYCSDNCYFLSCIESNRAKYTAWKEQMAKSPKLCYSCNIMEVKSNEKYCIECLKLPINVRRGSPI